MAKSKTDWPRKITVGSVTVKVYEVAHATNANGKAYVVAWTTPTGRKTSMFANPSAALEEARLQAGKLAAGKVEAADMTGGEHDELLAARKLAGDVAVLSALREWRDAKKLAGDNLMAAVRFYADHQQNTKRKTVLVKDAVTLFVKSKIEEGVIVKTSYARVLPRLAAGNLAALPIDAIGKEQLADWIREEFTVEGAEAIHPETFNTVRRRFVTLWKWARDEGYLPKLARTAPEEIKTRKDTKDAEIGIMTVEAWRAALDLIKAKHPSLLACLVIGGFCGLRRAELMAQKWDDINLKERHLRVTKAKARTPARRLVTLPPAAVEWLMACPRDSELIGPSWGPDHVRKHLRDASIDCPENALRHSFISYRCASTGSVDTTAQDAGNTAKIVFQHYRALVTKPAGKEWFAVSPNPAKAKASKVVSFPEKKTA